jgi:hypothetical protein
MRWVLLFLVLSLGSARAEEPADPFAPEIWQSGQGKWRFEKNGEVLCEGSGYSSLLYRRGVKEKNLELSVEVMFLGPESSAGIFIRAAGKDFYYNTTFYQFEWYTRGHHHDRRLSLMKKNPRWKQIVTPLVRDPPLEKWIQLRLRAKNDLLEAFVDGERVFEKRDQSFLREGGLGLHVFQPHPVRFRNFQLKKL